MGRRMRTCIAACVAMAAFGVFGGANASSPDELLRSVNVTRGEAGVPPLREDAALDAIALDHSADMSEAGRIFHNLHVGDEADAARIRWTTIGENVGSGANVDQIERALVASPHHYANLVDPLFTRIGLGVISGPDGRVYVTQVFAAIAAPQPRPVVRVAVVPEFRRSVVVRRTVSRPTDLMRTEDGQFVPEIYFSASVLPDDGWLGDVAGADPVTN
jgi:hypothetical protein